MAETIRTEYRLENLSCANCAMKFEKNVSRLPNVEAATVNFGASKLSFAGNASIDELLAAGAFDGIRVVPISQRKPTEKVPFSNAEKTLCRSFLFYS